MFIDTRIGPILPLNKIGAHLFVIILSFKIYHHIESYSSGADQPNQLSLAFLCVSTHKKSEKLHIYCLPFCPIQVLQRYRSSAGSGVYGRGHSLHHLRGSGEGPERCLEDGLRWTPRCYTSRSVQTGR